MSRRFWIVAAMCAALTIGTFTPENAQAGWRRRAGFRLHGYRWRAGWGAGRHYARRFRRFGFGAGFGAGFGGSYYAGFRSPYASPFGGQYYVSNYSVNPYLVGGYNTLPVTSAPGLYIANFAAQPNVALPYPAAPVFSSNTATSFLARHSVTIRNTDPSPVGSQSGTSFLARHSLSRENAIASSESPGRNSAPANGYGYGLASRSGYSYKSGVVNAPRDLANFGLNNFAMNPTSIAMNP